MAAGRKGLATNRLPVGPLGQSQNQLCPPGVSSTCTLPLPCLLISPILLSPTTASEPTPGCLEPGESCAPGGADAPSRTLPLPVPPPAWGLLAPCHPRPGPAQIQTSPYLPGGLVPPAPFSCWTLQECSHFADRETKAQVGEGSNAANQA